MGSSRIRALTVKEIEKLTSVAPAIIKHRSLGGVPGFVLVHTPQNYTSFALVYRHGGKRKKLTLGSAKALSLGEARKLAGKFRAQIEAGADPHGDKIKNRREASTREALGALPMWERYMALVGKQLRTRNEKDRIFKRYILPVIEKLDVSDVKKSHALKVLDPLIDRGKLRMADTVRQEGAAWFAWLVEREHVDRNPFAGLRKAQASKVIRTRVLSDEELRYLWEAAEPEGRWGAWVKLLVLTGARNMEARAARWAEFDLGRRIWTIPPERAKNKTGHQIFLSDAALRVMETIPRFADSDLVFPAAGNPKNPMSGDQKVKDRIDKRLRAKMEERGLREPGGWCIHDLRRTVATGVQRLGFRPDIADQVIGHVSSTRAGAGAHYLHYKYEDEKRLALEAWGAHVRATTSSREEVGH